MGTKGSAYLKAYATDGLLTQDVMGAAKAGIKAEESASRGGEFLRIE